jgi:peptide/nickel transport system substrate-binding protein
MDGNTGASTEHFRNSFVEPLTQRIVNTSQLKGLAAESWETVNGNPAHWRFKLRRNITFHNGERFNAQAAATSINFIKMPERGMIYTESVGGPHKPVVVDEHTLDILCESGCPLAATGVRFAYFQAPDWYSKATKDERASKFVASGPFKLVSWDRGISLKSEPFENYWQGKVQHIPQVTIFWREEDTVRAAMVKTGEADWAYDVGIANINNVPKAVVGASSEVVVLKINSKNREAFKDPRVRKALRHAIDCEAINKQLYSGMGFCRGSPFNPALTGSRDDIQKPYEYNPVLARRLLEEANYFSKWPNFEFKIMSRSGRFPRDVEMMEAMVGYWQKVGLKAGVAVVEPSIWSNHSNQNDRKSPNYGVGADIISWPHGNETGDSWFSLRNLLCNHRSGYACDDWLEPQIIPSAALVGTEREQKLHDLWKYVYDTALFPAILELPSVYGVSKDMDFIPREEREVRWNEQIKWLR